MISVVAAIIVKRTAFSFAAFFPVSRTAVFMGCPLIFGAVRL
jgi:hypothetical protein